MIVVVFLRFVWFVLFSLGSLVKVDFAALGCRLGLVILAFRLTFSFLLILGSLVGGLGIGCLSLRHGIGLLGGWLRATLSEVWRGFPTFMRTAIARLGSMRADTSSAATNWVSQSSDHAANWNTLVVCTAHRLSRTG